VKQREKNVKTE